MKLAADLPWSQHDLLVVPCDKQELCDNPSLIAFVDGEKVMGRPPPSGAAHTKQAERNHVEQILSSLRA